MKHIPPGPTNTQLTVLYPCNIGTPDANLSNKDVYVNRAKKSYQYICHIGLVDKPGCS